MAQRSTSCSWSPQATMIRFPVILALLLALWPHFAAAPTPRARPPEQIRTRDGYYHPLVNPRLVVWICRAETNRDFDAFGEKHGEIGACQIRLGSAREAVPSYMGSNQSLVEALFTNPYWWAQRLADKCFREGWRTAYQIAYCYNGGWRNRRGFTNSNGQARRYAKKIASRWEADRLKLHWISGSDL